MNRRLVIRCLRAGWERVRVAGLFLGRKAVEGNFKSGFGNTLENHANRPDIRARCYETAIVATQSISGNPALLNYFLRNSITQSFLMSINWSIVTAVASIIAALGGALAALASMMSASTAKKAETRATEIEERSLRRSVDMGAHGLVSESLSADHLANKVKIAVKELAAHSGARGGSRMKMLVESAEATQRELASIQREARNWIEQGTSGSNLSILDLDKQLILFETRMTQLQAKKRKLELDYNSIDQDNRIYRERAIHRKGST